MKKLIRLFRIIRVSLWRFNNDFKHWDRDKVKGITVALLLFSFAAQSQPHITVEKFDDNAAHVYAGMGITVITGAAVYKVTKKPGLALLGGFLAGVGAGWIKEKVYDGMMHKGVNSNRDGWNTTWGSGLGIFVLGAGISVHRTNQQDKEYFQHLNDSLQHRLMLPDPLITINTNQR